MQENERTAVPLHRLSGESSQWQAMREDVVEGLRAHTAWRALAAMDIRHKYRRSILGPFWITITMGVLIAGVGVIYSKLFGMSLKEYLPFIAVGNIVWIYISSLFQEACLTFTSAESLIRSTRIPMTVHVLRVVLRAFVVFLHGAVIYIPVALMYHVPSAEGVALALFGVLLVFLFTIPVVVFLGILATRFRDLPPIISNFMQLLFFITPILWDPKMLKEKRFIADLNPFYHLVEVVRAPLLGEAVPWTSYATVGISTALLLLIAIPVFMACRQKLSIWV